MAHQRQARKKGYISSHKDNKKNKHNYFITVFRKEQKMKTTITLIYIMLFAIIGEMFGWAMSIVLPFWLSIIFILIITKGIEYARKH